MVSARIYVSYTTMTPHSPKSNGVEMIHDSLKPFLQFWNSSGTSGILKWTIVDLVCDFIDLNLFILEC